MACLHYVDNVQLWVTLGYQARSVSILPCLLQQKQYVWLAQKMILPYQPMRQVTFGSFTLKQRMHSEFKSVKHSICRTSHPDQPISTRGSRVGPGGDYRLFVCSSTHACVLVCMCACNLENHLPLLFRCQDAHFLTLKNPSQSKHSICITQRLISDA